MDDLDEIAKFLDSTQSTAIQQHHQQQQDNEPLISSPFTNCFMDELDDFTLNTTATTSTVPTTQSPLKCSSNNSNLDNLQLSDITSSSCYFSQEAFSNLLFEALDGFFFIINLKGIIETVSDTVSFYTKYTPVRLFIFSCF